MSEVSCAELKHEYVFVFIEIVWLAEWELLVESWSESWDQT